MGWGTPWPYALVFLGTVLVDVVPLPLPPAFTVMVALQILFRLNIWFVIAIGVPGSVLGRYILSLYIPRLSGRLFTDEKNQDVAFLGKKLETTGWKGFVFILIYSLMPLPTAPLFIAGGMARMKAYHLIPPFLIGKLTSDTIAVLMGAQAVNTLDEWIHGLASWKTIAGSVVGLILVFALLFFDWRTLLQQKRITLRFSIWK
jgi:membrane protein DedA with SNARE-associated domain